MPIDVKVNGPALSVVTKSSSGQAPATLPDMCKTPGPPGPPPPLPYPNVAQSAMLSKGTTTVKVDGVMAATKPSEFSMSNGDEPGVAGGVNSNTFIKEATWVDASPDVKMDGDPVCRLTDPMLNNHENTATTPGVVQSPVMLILDESLIGATQEEACEKYNKTKVDDHDQACKDSGMRRDDFDAMKMHSNDKNMAVSVRATNPESTKYIGQGKFECKPASCQQSTQKEGPYAGLVLSPNPKSPPPPAKPLPDIPPPRYTGDYDLHDILHNGQGGAPGRSALPSEQGGLIDGMNGAMNPGGNAFNDRIKHGPASTLGNYLQEHPELQTADGGRRMNYLNPMCSEKDPLTVFDNGEVHQLRSEEDVINMYKCKGIPVPPQWNLHVTKIEEVT